MFPVLRELHLINAQTMYNQVQRPGAQWKIQSKFTLGEKPKRKKNPKQKLRRTQENHREDDPANKILVLATMPAYSVAYRQPSAEF